MLRRSVPSFLLAGALLLAASPAEAAFHLWDIKEVYSNADGSIQYIELFNSFDNEQFVNGVQIVATSDGVSRTFTFSGNLSTNQTANKHLLIATPGFASLPGAVTPDYILPCGPFFNPGATTITIDFTTGFGSIDAVTFTGASLPTNGRDSLTDSTVGSPTTTLVAGQSSPANFAGSAGALALTGCLQTGACDACDDGLYCNGQESCSASACVAGPGCIGTCNEDSDTCDLHDLIFYDGFDTGGLDYERAGLSSSEAWAAWASRRCSSMAARAASASRVRIAW
jgi:hypothetical protein